MPVEETAEHFALGGRSLLMGVDDWSFLSGVSEKTRDSLESNKQKQQGDSNGDLAASLCTPKPPTPFAASKGHLQQQTAAAAAAAAKTPAASAAETKGSASISGRRVNSKRLPAAANGQRKRVTP